MINTLTLPGINTRSLRFRLTLWYSTALIISIAIIFASFYFITERELYRHTDLILTSHGRQVAQTLQKQPGLAESRLSPETFNDFGAIPGMLIIVTDKQGTIIESNYPKEIVTAGTNELFNKIKSTRQELFVTQSFPGTVQRIILIPLATNSSLTGVMIMGHPVDVIQKSLNSLLVNLVSLFFLLVFPTIFGGFVLAKRAIQPVDMLSTQMEKITSENLKERVSNPHTHDEIERLAHTFNNLLSRLEAAFARERQFIGDVAHELKTPLATQRSGLEVTLAKRRTIEEYKQAISEAIIDNNRISTTLKNILDLAWSEAENTNAHEEVFNLSILLLELGDLASKMAVQKHITIKSHIHPDISIHGKQDKVGRAVLNIIDNAINYTKEYGTVWISLVQQGSSAVIKIKDSGPGIYAEDLPHIFERFYRGKTTGKTVGAGLGLSIAQSIIKVHKGHLHVGSTHGIGTTVTITFLSVNNLS